jgi:Cu(I)/Ag(I) efflux system membrane protein CusA/SilA
MLTTGVRTELGIKLYGEDIRILQQKAFEIEQALGSMPGISDLLAERVLGATYLEMRVDRGNVARYGLNVADVEDAVELSIGGKNAATTIEGRKRFNVMVRYNRENRESINAMRNIFIPVTGGGTAMAAADDGMGGGSAAAPAMGGGMGGGSMAAAPATTKGESAAGAVTGPAYVPLSELAQFRVVDGPSMISAEDGMPLVTIQMNSRGRDVIGFVNEANQIIKEHVNLPPSYSYKWTGQYENQQRAKERLAVVIPVVIALMLFLLYMAFNSLGDAILILMNIPFSLVGGIVAMYLSETYFTVSAAVGYIALGGIALENGLIMVSQFKLLRADHSLKDAVFEGALSRMRPVMMTAGTTLAGSIVLLYSTGTGSEIQLPMTMVVTGGLITSTILTLILLPCVYLFWRQWDERKSE